jgi:predicted  nucleic acid-binding Zn-ribbon protein
LKKGLDILYTLQLKDDQIKKIQTTIKKIPIEITNLKNERDNKTSIIETAKNKLKTNVKEREKLEKEILMIKEQINKYRDQMKNASTNKEYQGFTAEIKYQEDKIQGVEERIIAKMLESDEIMEEIRKSEEEFNQIATQYDSKIQVLDKELEENQGLLKTRNKEKDKLRKEIPPKLVKVYDNLFEKKKGKVISCIESDFCGVCHVKIRPQLLSEIIISDKIFICENCGRIFHIKSENPQEEGLGK